MKSVQELEEAFAIYFTEMDACENAKCYWALLHVALVMPDICAALEFGSSAAVGDRYRCWCGAHFPADPKLTPPDRYQIRCALLHQGSTLPDSKQTQYSSISFTDPNAGVPAMHLVVCDDGGKNLVLNVVTLAHETRVAVRHWFAALEKDGAANAAVEGNLRRLVRRQTKLTVFPLRVEIDPDLVERGFTIESATLEVRYPTTSST
jgi:hypothetical protein